LKERGVKLPLVQGSIPRTCSIWNETREKNEADWYSGIKESLCYTISAPLTLPRE
jgi:hypothetical protein